MNRRNKWASAVTLGLVGLAGTVLIAAGGSRGKETAPKDITVVGRVVDLHSYMTGRSGSNDMVRWTQMAIRAGVPAAVETDDGIIIIGQGDRGPMRTILPFAYKNAELRGKLHEKDGIPYLDIVSAKKAQSGDDEEMHAEEADEYDPDGPPDE